MLVDVTNLFSCCRLREDHSKRRRVAQLPAPFDQRYAILPRGLYYSMKLSMGLLIRSQNNVENLLYSNGHRSLCLHSPLLLRRPSQYPLDLSLLQSPHPLKANVSRLPPLNPHLKPSGHLHPLHASHVSGNLPLGNVSGTGIPTPHHGTIHRPPSLIPSHSHRSLVEDRVFSRLRISMREKW